MEFVQDVLIDSFYINKFASLIQKGVSNTMEKIALNVKLILFLKMVNALGGKIKI
jgi:hypothetical protein